MAGKFGKGKRVSRQSSRRKSQAWRYLSRRDNSDNFEGRTIFVGGKGLTTKDQADSSNSNSNSDGEDNDDLQIHFVNNTIKSSKYTIWTFFPR